MERIARLARCLLCAVLAAAVLTSASAASAASAKTRHQRRATCVVLVKRHGAKHGQTTRRLVRCTKRIPKRRARIALKGRGTKASHKSSGAKKPAPKLANPAPSGSSQGGSIVSGGLDVGLITSVAGWTDEASRMDQIESQTGTHWMREEFTWSQIEPSRGNFDFSRYDTLMTLAAHKGVHVLPDLLDTPSWAGPSWNTIPSDPSAYADFVAAVVRRYGPHGSFWAAHPDLPNVAVQTFELWNEPYYSQYNNGAYSPARYARLVKAAGAAGHAADSSARFLLAAENTTELVGGTWVWWVDALYQAVPDLNKYFDGVAVHPYGTNFTNVSYPTPGKAYDGDSQIRRLESIRAEFVRHGGRDKPFWITEIGWPTCTDGGSDRCTTPSGQARDIQAVFNYARTNWKSYLQAIFVYGYQDNNPNTADPENDYGLVYHDGTPKPALNVFEANR